MERHPRARRTARALGLLLACLALPRAAAAQPVGYRPVPAAEVPRAVLGAARDWARQLDEVKAVLAYLRDRENWSPGLIAGAGAFGYFVGGRGTAHLGGWDLRLDTAGQGVQSLLRRREGRLLTVGLGRPASGWSADAALGVRDGRFLSDAVNIGYKLRY